MQVWVRLQVQVHEKKCYLAQPIPQLTSPMTWNLPLTFSTRGLPLSPCRRKEVTAKKDLSITTDLTTVSTTVLIAGTQEVLGVDFLLSKTGKCLVEFACFAVMYL